MLINKNDQRVLVIDIVDTITRAEVPLCLKAIASRLNIDQTSEALLEIRDTCYECDSLVDIHDGVDSKRLRFDAASNYA